jgi:hypothetical protein
MKRDVNLLRGILFAAERGCGGAYIEGEDVLAHARLLEEAGFITTVDHSNLRTTRVRIDGVTWRGAEFLDAIRSDAQWDAICERLQGESAPVALIEQLAYQLAGDKIGLRQVPITPPIEDVQDTQEEQAETLK